MWANTEKLKKRSRNSSLKITKKDTLRLRQNNRSLQRTTLEDFSNLYVYLKKKSFKKSVNKYGQTLMRFIPEMVTVATVYCETETTTFPLSTMPSPATTEVKGI